MASSAHILMANQFYKSILFSFSEDRQRTAHARQYYSFRILLALVVVDVAIAVV